MLEDYTLKIVSYRFHGVMVSTLAFEFSDPSSNLGGTNARAYLKTFFSIYLLCMCSRLVHVVWLRRHCVQVVLGQQFVLLGGFVIQHVHHNREPITPPPSSDMLFNTIFFYFQWGLL